MSATDWQQVDEYYWSGPGGWTICRVFVNGGWIFELWSGGECRGSRASLEGAVALQQQIT
ncbi:hypothetical protein GCM10027288_17930 [Bordetella tumbae]